MLGVGSPFDYGDGLRSNTPILRIRVGPLSSCRCQTQTAERSNQLLRQTPSRSGLTPPFALLTRLILAYRPLAYKPRSGAVQLTSSVPTPNILMGGCVAAIVGFGCFHGTLFRKSNRLTLVPYCQLRVPGYSIEPLILRLDCVPPLPFNPPFPSDTT